jgi:hypothetical protein
MERAAFAHKALEQLKKARPHEAYVLDEDKFHITRATPDGKTSLVSLSNYYDEYVHAAPAAKSGVFDRIVKFAAFIDSEETFDEVRVVLTPRIRPRRYFEIDALELMASLGTEGAAKVPVYTPFAEHLGVSLAIDRPEHIEYVSDPSKYALPKSELDAIALANLRRNTKGGLEEVKPGLFLGHWGDEYAPERMLIPELFEGLSLKGDPVVFIPGAERIYVVGSGDEESLMMALVLVDERMKTPRALLDFAFVLKGGAWSFFEPPGPIGVELGARLALHLASAYAKQREMLEKKYEGEDGAPFIPNVMGLGKDGEIAMTLTTWTKDVHALLPRTNLVGMPNLETNEIVTAAWHDVMELAGGCLKKVPDLYPPRWETTGFPSAEVVAELRARAPMKSDAGGEADAGAPPSVASAPSTTPPAPSKTRHALIAVVTMLLVATIVYVLRSK